MENKELIEAIRGMLKEELEPIHEEISKVKDRLLGTNKTVSEIAYEVGFQYPHHLSRLFKKVAGCTPNEYRMQLR